MMKLCRYLMLPCIISACIPWGPGPILHPPTPTMDPTTCSVAPFKNGGCYADCREARILPMNISSHNNDLTTEKCIGLCKDAGFIFAGLQVGTECWCGNDKPCEPPAPDYQCQFRCSGNPEEICGDFFRNNVYLTDRNPPPPTCSETPFKNGGCYADCRNPRILPKEISSFNNNLTIEKCIGLCWDEGWKFAGLQVGTECWCGNDKPCEPPAPDYQCQFPCSGNRDQICGDFFRNNVFRTDQAPPTERCPEQGGQCLSAPFPPFCPQGTAPTNGVCPPGGKCCVPTNTCGEPGLGGRCSLYPRDPPSCPIGTTHINGDCPEGKQCCAPGE